MDSNSIGSIYGVLFTPLFIYIFMYLSVLILPLFASLIANNRYVGIKGGPILSILCLMMSAILCLFVFYEVAIKGSNVSFDVCNWLDLGNLLIPWSLYYDTLTVSMYLPIIIISFLIQIYSLEYD